MLAVPPPTILRHPILYLKLLLGYVGLPGGYSAEEIQGLENGKKFQREGAAYMTIQRWNPQVRYTHLSSTEGLTDLVV